MKQDPIRRHRWAIVFPIALFAMFIPGTVDWMRETGFDKPGEIVNAVIYITTLVLLPGVFGWLIWTGQLRRPEHRFLEQGYLGTASLSRSKPGLAASLIGLAFLLILGSLAVPLLAGFVTGELLELPPLAILMLLPLLVPVFGYAWAILYLFARFWVNRDIARHMAGLSSGGSGATVRQAPPPDTGSDLQLRMISEQPKPVRRIKGVTLDSNCLGLDPVRLLYLWNFDVGYPRYEINSWRQFGPVYWLWGPANIPASRYLQMAWHRNPVAHFASTQSDIDQWLDRGREAPRRGLLRQRYPELPIACLANIWQDAIRHACSHVDAVIVDARSFTTERSGLSWEIDHVVRSLPPERFLLLADMTTDIRALARLTGATGAAQGARVLYPPLPLDREALKRMFDKEQVPRLNYRASSLVHLLTGESPDPGTPVTLRPLPPAN